MKKLSKVKIIKQDILLVLDYLSILENLCKWTRFFRKLNKIQNNIGYFDTPLGEVQTQILTQESNNEAQVIISSNINGRNEQAQLCLSSENKFTKVIFQVPLPSKATEEFIKKQGLILEDELKMLASLVGEIHV